MARAEVVLELSGKEAGVLLKILGRVGGSPSGPRGAADSIQESLKRLGLVPIGHVSGEISFNKDW